MITLERQLTVLFVLGLLSGKTGATSYSYLWHSSPSYYCRSLQEDPLLSLFGICLDREGYGLSTFAISCLSVSVFFVLVTFIVYSVVPRLRNLQGSIFRCTLASYMCCMIIYIALLLQDLYSLRFKAFYDVYMFVSVIIMSYFGFAWILWLNVMSFNVWRTFRKLRPSRKVNDSDKRKRQRKNFIWYSCYAWIGSVVLLLSLGGFLYLLAWCSDHLQRGGIFDSAWHYGPMIPIVGIAICNTCLFISTALKIRQRKRETAYLVDGFNKHQQKDDEWFNLYLKLFIIMEGPLMFWGVGIYLENLIFWWIVYLLDALQGTFIFLIFVWKQNVKELLQKKFQKMLCTLRAFCQCGPILETGDEKPSTELLAITAYISDSGKLDIESTISHAV